MEHNLDHVKNLKLVPQLVDKVFEEWWRHSSQQVQGQVRRAFNSLVILGD
jgi:hypothetical protein